MFVYICTRAISNGKPLNSREEAIQYLYQTILHSKTHLNAKLIDMKADEESFTIITEEYDYFKGRTQVKHTIKTASLQDANLIKKYFEINGIHS